MFFSFIDSYLPNEDIFMFTCYMPGSMCSFFVRVEVVIERQLTFVGSLYTYKDGFDFFIISPAYKLNVQIGP